MSESPHPDSPDDPRDPDPSATPHVAGGEIAGTPEGGWSPGAAPGSDTESEGPPAADFTAPASARGAGRLAYGWITPLAAGLGATVLAMVASTVVLVVAILVMADPGIMSSPAALQAWIMEQTATVPGLLIIILPGQLTFLAVALVGAAFSRERAASRLLLRAGQLPVWTWPILIAGAPTVGLLMSLVVTALMQVLNLQPSEHLQSIETILASFTGWKMLVLVLLIAVLPGAGEELLFRGYIQGRLLKHWHPIYAIGFASACFALAHVDPMHMFIVFPIGVWLGVICWRTGSIWPAILGHLCNNLLSILAGQIETLGLTEMQFINGSLAVCGLFFVLSVGLLVTLRPRPEEEKSESAERMNR